MADYSKTAAKKDSEPEPEDKDDTAEVELDDQSEAEKRLKDYDPEDEDNLAELFGKSDEGLQVLKEISELIRDNVKQGQEDSQEEKQRIEKEIGLLLGELPTKQAGYENSANVHVPIMLKGASRLVARLGGELFQDWRTFVSVFPVSDGPEELKQVDVLSKHTNWQLTSSIPDFREQAELGLMYGIIYPNAVCHSTYDSVRRCNRHEMLTPEEFVMPAVRTQTMPDLSDVPWRARILHYYRHTLESMEGIWFDVDKVLSTGSPSWDDDQDDERISREAMRIAGKEPTENEDSAPYKIIWYEGWLRLPKQEQQRFCKAIIDQTSGAVFHLGLHEQDNWKDRVRFDRQLQELQAYRLAVDNFSVQRDQLQQQMNDMDRQMQMPLGAPESIVQRVQMQTQRGMLADQAAAMSPPPPPEWASGEADEPEFEPEPVMREPIQMFSIMRSLDPPSGPVGIPFGRMLADYNRAADTALSQFIDQATLNNCKSFVGKEGVQFTEKAALKPGDIKHIVGFDGDDIRTALMEIDVGQGNPQLVDVVNMCVQYADDAIQAPGVLAGDPGKSGETARGYAMRREQATKQLTTLARRFARFYEQIIKNNAAINAECMPDEELFMVQDPETRQWQGLRAGRKLYARDYAVGFSTDMEFSSKAEKVGNAQTALQLIASIPNATLDAPLVQYGLRKVFEAMGLRDYLPYMGPQAPPPQTPMGLPMPGPPGQPGVPGAQPQQAPQGGGPMPPNTSPAPAPRGQPSPPAPKQPAAAGMSS